MPANISNQNTSFLVSSTLFNVNAAEPSTRGQYNPLKYAKEAKPNVANP